MQRRVKQYADETPIAEPECRCYCVGDQADASECLLHAFRGVESHPAETPDEDPFGNIHDAEEDKCDAQT